MELKELIKRARKLSEPFRVTKGKNFNLKDFDPSDTADLEREDKPRAGEALAMGVEALCELQERLYAQDKWALLLVFQAIDAAGKDSAIKHVMSGINPQGCQVYTFKQPSNEDLDHDYLWRCLKVMPERGRIGIFNRSYYEELVVVKVHPEYLSGQKIPERLIGKNIWKQRARDIRNVEEYLGNNGVVIRKFFLNVSKKEQKKRFLERLDKPEKNWKFSLGDLEERRHWDAYQDAYQEAIRGTASDVAPWYVVPADNKWFTRVVVAGAVIDALGSMDLNYPKVTADGKRDLEIGRKELLGT